MAGNRPEGDSEGFSFEMQIDLKEGYGFEDFPEFSPHRNDREKSGEKDEPHFNPKELAAQRPMSATKLNPFADQSKDHSRTRQQD